MKPDFINNILLNMMKHQLVIIYQTFDENPKLLDNPVVRKAYHSLVSVSSTDEFDLWSKLLDASGLSFKNSDGCEVGNNVLAHFDDIASGADKFVKYEFVKWKRSFSPEDWKQANERNCKAVAKLQKIVSRDYDVHIVLAKCGHTYVAVGDDADRLFEIFGWQTGHAYNGNEYVSFMYVNAYGFEVLRCSPYSVRTIEDAGEAIVSLAFSEDTMSAYQQLTDYIVVL